MIALTLSEIAAACGGRLHAGDPAGVFTRVTTDSRAVLRGDLFVGLRGERFDGDAYAAEAVRDGAVGVVVREETAVTLPKRAAVVVVDDGLAALGRLAAEVRRRSHVTVVAVTGSAGKTSTKDILAALLRPVVRVVATRGNFNNEVGVPLTLLSIDESTEVVVTELAMRGLGQIADLTAVARPDVGVITNVAPVHLELVGTVERVAEAKAELLDEMGQGTAVVPSGEPLLQSCVKRFRGRVVTFGDEAADVFVVESERRGARTHALVDAFGRRARFTFNFSGGHYLEDATAALAAFVALGHHLEEAKTGAARIELSGLRGEVGELPGGGLLLNDAYNANPLSMRAALDHLLAIAERRPAVAILGDMYELGSSAAAFHQTVGAYAAQKRVRVIAVGELARDYLTGRAGEAWYATVEECVAALPGAVAPGSAVLVKASRALRLERVAEALLHPERPAKATAASPPGAEALSHERARDRSAAVTEAFKTKRAGRGKRAPRPGDAGKLGGGGDA